MTTDFRALCAELLADYEEHLYRSVLADRARAALAEPVAERPTDEEIDDWRTRCADLTRVGKVDHYWAFDLPSDTVADIARAVLARWGNLPESPDSSDGPAVSDDREPASVTDQVTTQLHRRATVLLIRKVIDQALRDTASVQWRVADTGEQLVRATDLLAWAEHMEKQMEQIID